MYEKDKERATVLSLEFLASGVLHPHLSAKVCHIIVVLRN